MRLFELIGSIMRFKLGVGIVAGEYKFPCGFT